MQVKFVFENVWGKCEGRRIYVSLLLLAFVVGATTGNWSKILLYLINLEDRHCSRVNFVLETRTLLKIRQLSLRNIKWGFL